MTIKQLYEEVRNKDDALNIFNEWVNIFNELLTDLKIENPKIEKMVSNDLYVSVYGEHFDKETSHAAVAGMQNTDGSVGEHWDLEQTTNAAKQAGIVFKRFNEYDFYFVLNMLYSDNYGVFGNDSNTYIQLAKAWLEDIDVAEGKAWRYYQKVVKSY